MSEVRRILEYPAEALFLAGTSAVFEVLETSSSGKAGDPPTEESLDFKRPEKGEACLIQAVLLTAGIKVCLHREETGEFVLHKVQVHGSVIWAVKISK